MAQKTTSTQKADTAKTDKEQANKRKPRTTAPSTIRRELLAHADVMRMCVLPQVTIYALRQERKQIPHLENPFPEPVVFLNEGLRWHRHEIETWIVNLPRAQDVKDLPPPREKSQTFKTQGRK